MMELDGLDPGGAGRAKIAEAMWMKSRSFAGAGNTEAELAELERLAAGFIGAAEPRVRLTVARALYNMGGLLRDLGRTDEALRAWDQVLEHFAVLPPGGNDVIANTLSNKANYLARIGRWDDAIATCDVLLNRYGRDTSPPMEVTVGQAMGIRLHALMSAGSGDQAVTAADELLNRFGDSTNPDLRSEIVRALGVRTWVAMHTGQRDAAIAASNVLAAKFERTTDPLRTAIVGDALCYTGATLMDQKPLGPVRLWSNHRNKACREQGLKILELLRERLASAGDPELSKLMVHVMIETGAALAQVGRVREAVAVLDAVFDVGEPALAAFREDVAVAEQSPRPRERLALALAGEVAVLHGLGRRDEADAKMVEIITRFQGDRSPVIKLIVHRARHDRER